MKLLLLKVLLQRRARDEGFTLPMVIALGLVMILLGAINITSANEENLNAITQNSRSDALAIAEIGVTRYRELLDRNRVLTLYNSDEWAGRADVCNDEINDDFTVGSLNSPSSDITIAEDGLELNNDGDATDSFLTGSYSLVSYQYSNPSGAFDLTDDTANNNALGTLVVRGTTPDGDGAAQISVDIPIRINLQDVGNLAPALWIGDNTISAADLGSGNLTIGNGGNVVIKDQAITTAGSEADGCRDFTTLATATGLTIISDARDIPSIQPIIDTIAAAEAVAGDQTNGSIPADGILGRINADPYVEPPAGATFDENVHCADIRDCRYYYKLINAQTINGDVQTDGIAEATLYTNSTLSIDATGDDVSVGSRVASNYFEIYVNGNNNITIDTSAGNTVTIDAFIHAPQSTLEITGAGTVNINGSVWVNDFVTSANATVNISPDQSRTSSTVSNRAYEFYTTTNSRTPKPITGSPVNWKTEEVN